MRYYIGLPTRASCLTALVALISCKATSVDAPPESRLPFNHVLVLVLENHHYTSVIGNPLMPYYNSLATQYGLASNYFSNQHPSIGDYFMMTVGDTITHADNWTAVVDEDNIVRRVDAAGLSWKVYAEDLPSAGYMGSTSALYVRRHNVFAYIADVARDSAQARRMVPFTQLARDLAGDTLPNYAMIIPNLCHDADQCTVDSADNWLQANIAPLIASPSFQDRGLLVLTWDESGADTTHGGGKVAWVAVSPLAKRGYRSNTLYQHESTLRLSLKALGITSYPNHAALARDMDEFFDDSTFALQALSLRSRPGFK